MKLQTKWAAEDRVVALDNAYFHVTKALQFAVDAKNEGLVRSLRSVQRSANRAVLAATSQVRS
jgi:hypothetical protein